jgi:excinuclease ABC subunit A
LSLAKGAIAGWDEKNYLYHSMLVSLANHFDIDINKKFYSLPGNSFKKALFYGSDEEIDFTIVKLDKKTKKFISTKKNRSMGRYL